MTEVVPKATERRTGGFRRLAGFDSSRPYGTASLARSSRERLSSPGYASMTTPTAWETNTLRQVNTANVNRQWATGARWTTTETQDISNHSVMVNTSAIQEALVSKTAETQKLYELLQDTLKTVEHEMAVLQSLPAKRLASYIRQTEEKIHLNMKRLEVRKNRPKNELTDDEVHAQLLNMDRMLRQRLAQLMHCQKAVFRDIKLLQESKLQIEADIVAKKNALAVDTNVLSNNLDFGATTKAAPGNHKMTIHPGVWTGSTQAIVKVALQRQADAAKLHLACDNVCQEAAVEEKANRQNLHLATLDKINKTKSLKSVLEMEREKVVDELDRVVSHERNLCEQILDLEDTMNVTKDRYTYRCQRPDREKVVDEVELQMKKSIKEQKALHSNLMMSKPSLTANIASLKRNQAILEHNIQEKLDCFMVDEQSLLVDGRRAPSLAPSNVSYRTAYGGTQLTTATSFPTIGNRASVSQGGSRAESLRSRISELEDELAETRRSNDVLIQKRNQLIQTP